jgi:hypothetical protein
MTILIANATVIREVASGLVVTFFCAVVALDAGLLRDLHRIHGLGERRLDCGDTWPRRQLRSWGIRCCRRPSFGRVLPNPHLFPLDLFLLVGGASIEPHVILSTAVLIVVPLWRMIAVPVTTGIPLPPATLLLCTLAKHSLQPMPIIRVEVIEGALGASPGVTAAAVHRRR